MSKPNDRKPLVFLITGVARAGKDTFAAALSEEMTRNGSKVETFKFANVLKTALARTLEWMDVEKEGLKPIDIAFTESENLKPRVRDALVSLGKLARHVDSSIFARHLVTEVCGFIEFCPWDRRAVAVVPDWRYVNEYEICKKYLDAEVITVEIQRPGYEPANDEEAESLSLIFSSVQIKHIRVAADPITLRGMAKEIAYIYR